MPVTKYWKDERVYATSEADPNYAKNMRENEGPPRFWKDVIKRMGESERVSKNEVEAES